MPSGIYIRTPQTRANISLSKMGSSLSSETRAKISLARTGPVESAETRARKSVAMMGHGTSIETRAKISATERGKAVSPETRARISAAGMGRVHSPETRVKMGVAHWRGGSQVWGCKYRSKRRGMGHVYLNEPFVGCDGHRVDNEQIINMPRELHRGKGHYHDHNTGQGMARMNAIAYNFLFKQEVEAETGGVEQ